MHIFKILLLGWLLLRWLLLEMATSDPGYFVDFKHVKIFSSHFVDFEHVKIFSSHFVDFEQVKKLVVILQTLNNNYRFMNFLIILYKEKK